MSNQVTVTLPDGYEDATHLVVVAPGTGKHDYEVYATVLGLPTGTEVQEVGGGGAVEILAMAGRVVKESVKRLVEAGMVQR